MLTESVRFALAIALLQSSALLLIECDFQKSAHRADTLAYFCRSTYIAVLGATIEAIQDDPAYILKKIPQPSSEIEIISKIKGRNYKHDVFISYSSMDQEQALIIYNAIVDAHKHAFLSAKNLNPGDDFAEEI